MDAINKINVDVALKRNVANAAVRQDNGKLFTDVLKQEVNKVTELKFSEHAKARMKDRNINLTDQDHVKIDNAVNNIAQKGAKESLLMLNDLALLVSVKNRTVITAIDQQAQSEKVFTNIDSAVIIR